MTDYTKTTNFTAKDNLSTGDPLKVIKGSLFDTEFDNLATAVATKYDSGDLASQAQAEAETSNVVLITPLRLANWADANGGMVGDIQALADPGADAILGWDDSASAAIGFTLGTGLAFDTTTVKLSHLGFEDLTDPGADRIPFWDETDNALNWGTAGNGIGVSAHTIGLVDVSASATIPFSITSGTFAWDESGLASAGPTHSWQSSADGFYISDNGVLEKLTYRDMHLEVEASQTTQTLALGDANRILEFNGTATVTIPANASVALPIGCIIILVVDHATQVVTVTADTGVTLNSIFHPGGGSAASDTVNSGGMAALIKTAADEWYLSGDISD